MASTFAFDINRLSCANQALYGLQSSMYQVARQLRRYNLHNEVWSQEINGYVVKLFYGVAGRRIEVSYLPENQSLCCELVVNERVAFRSYCSSEQLTTVMTSLWSQQC